MTVRLGEEGLGRKLDRASELAGDCGPAGENAAPELSFVRVWHHIGTSVRGVHTRRHCSVDVWPAQHTDRQTTPAVMCKRTTFTCRCPEQIEPPATCDLATYTRRSNARDTSYRVRKFTQLL